MKANGNVDWMLIFLIVYCAASLLHFSHNAIFLESYPNMPAWLSSTGVYAAWFAVTVVGAIGYLLLRGGYRLAGLALIAIYGGLGLDGLSHYRLAPFSAHTFTMNLTILLDVTTALLVIVAAARMAARRAFDEK
jgi:hypothetical protein